MLPARRRALLLGSIALALVLAVSTTLSFPRSRRATVGISRFGSAVRLLPQKVCLSSLLFERRVIVPRRGSEAVLDVALPFAFDDVRVPATLRLGIEGSGTLPLDARRIRSNGWEKEWGDWAQKNVLLSPDERRALVVTTRRWRAIFPDTPFVPEPQLLGRLRDRLPPLRIIRADLTISDEAVRAAAAAELARISPRRGRVVVLGLDALDWSLVDDLTRRGAMPNMRALLRESAQAELQVPPPLISPVVWTTIATGVPPEAHGVLDFLESDPGGGVRPVTSASRKAPAVWEMAAAAGRSTSAIGWWATFPAKAPPHGSVYSDRLTEQLIGLTEWVPGQADPPSADAIAHKLVWRADRVTAAALRPLASVSDSDLAGVRGSAGWDAPAAGLAKLFAATLTVEALTGHELRSGTDIVLSYLEGTDTVGHLFAQYRPPAMPGVNPADALRFGGVVDRYYAHVDDWLGRVRASLGRGDTLVVVSDHGFTWGSDRPRVPAGAHTATAVWWHKGSGVFIAAGPGIVPSAKRERMALIDVGPVLLRLCGLPPAAEMPGRVPGWLLSNRAAVAPALRYDALLAPERAKPVELPKEAQAEERAKLLALGYLGSAPAVSGKPATQPAAAAYDRGEARRLTNLGTSRVWNRDDKGGEEAFRRAAEADPTYAAAWYNLSLMKRKAQKLDEADELFWRAVDSGVADREFAIVRLALDYRDRGDFARAEDVLSEGRRRFPSSPAIWLNSGVFLGERGKLEEARSCLERAVSLAPSSAEAHRNLGVALLALGGRDAAVRELTEALRLDPSLSDVRRQLESLRR